MPSEFQSLNMQAAVAAESRRTSFPLKLFGEDGLTFRDIFDLVNPLHHIPLLGNLYRRITGDIIDPAIRIAGGALFGGPIGAGFAAVNVAIKQAMGAREAAIRETQHLVPHPTTVRGGWIVAASRAMRPPPVSPNATVRVHDAETTNAPERRGGWMVQAAYAMADARIRHAAIISSSRGIDTTV